MSSLLRFIEHRTELRIMHSNLGKAAVSIGKVSSDTSNLAECVLLDRISA